VSAAPDISLPRFEGPLDLLLALVRKNEVPITDIPIAEVTRQYLEYLHQAQDLNIDLGSDFVYFAALLIHIKSRSLLPADPEMAGREPDPREALVGQLMDHDQLHHGAEFLKQKLEIAEASWSRTAIDPFPPPPRDDSAEPNPSLNLLQILRLAQQALATARNYDLVTPNDPVSVEEMMGWLQERMARTPDRLEGTALLAEQPDAPHRNALFLAMLEMAKSAEIRIDQPVVFGPIAITKWRRGTTVPQR
jgi:segregation and condensation protein A